MVINLILALLTGLTVGANIVEKLNKDSIEINHSLIASQENLIKTYEGYIELLEDEYIDYYKDALNETLRQNIELKKKLKAYE